LLIQYLLHVSALTAPSSGRTLCHFSRPTAYCKVVITVELPSMKFIVLGCLQIVYSY